MSRRSRRKVRVFPILKKMWPFVRCYKLAFTVSVVGNLIYAGITALFTYILKPLLDKGFIAKDHTFLTWLPVIIIAIFLIRGCSNLVASYATARMSRGIILRITRSIFMHFQKMPASYYDDHTSGQLLSVMIYNVNQLANVSANALVTFLQSFGMIVGLLIVMFYNSWQLSLIYFVALPVIAIVVRLSNKHVRRISYKLQESMKNIISTAEENLEGYREVRAFGGQPHEAKKFTRFLKINRRHELTNVIIKTLTIMVVQIIAAFVLAFTAFIATTDAAGFSLSAGAYISLIAAMLAILKPMKDLANVNNIIQRGLVGAESVFSVLQLETEPDYGEQVVERAKGSIEFQDLSFSYGEGDKIAVADFNLTVPAGKVFALVGRSGAGKSTLVQLLPRYYHTYEGAIKIDGVDTRDFTLASLRHQFAQVSQNTTLFNETIANNISYGEFGEVDQARLVEAARLAHALEFIEEMPKGFDTIIGEDGVLLSGGQRQRLAIARAIYKDAPILILDEATSALDTESERFIQEGLEELMKNRTTVVIAHRLSTIMNADCIVVMDKGRIIEQGRHDELIAKAGHYAKLYQMQFKDE